MSRTIRAAVLSVALVAGLMSPVAAEGEEPVASSDTIEHITNEDYIATATSGAGTAVTATDSDFMTWTVPADLPPGAKVPPGVEPGRTRVLNVMGTYREGMQIADITDRENPVVVSVYDCVIQQADVFVFTQGEGPQERTYAAYTSDAVSGPGYDEESQCHADNADVILAEADARGVDPARVRGTFLVDITNPYEPTSAGFLPMRKGTHQVTLHPSGDYVYNSAAVVVTTRPGSIEVYDISDLAERNRTGARPELVAGLDLLTGLDVHDMTFSDDGERLYAAALTHSFVIDTSDAANPAIVGRIYDPAINIHHDAHRVSVETPLGERDFMLIGDELAGAAGNGACPGGGIHVYDVTGPLENAPVKVGAFFIPDLRPAGTGGDNGAALRCTAHVIQPIPGTTYLSVAWYNAGVRVLDYSGLADLNGAGPQVGLANSSVTPGITQVGYSYFADSDLWSAKVHEVADDGGFHIYGGDTRRGLDVWRFTPGADGSAGADDAQGTWLDADAARARAAVDQAGSTLADGYRPFCLLGR
jgi:hypothetical protein